MDIILNKLYYQELLKKYNSVDLLSTNIESNFLSLVIKMVKDNLKKKKSIHINFQNEKNLLLEIAKHLFIETANEIYCNFADFPDSKVGEKLKARNKRFSKNSILIFMGKRGDKYILKYENDDSYEIKVDEETFIQDFVQISQNVRDNTLKRFFTFFDKLNNKKIYFFNPTNFECKSVFIAPKTFYDSLEVKNKIPTTYFSNPREENILHETKSIPALTDSIMYFVSRYKIFYEQILQQGKKIDTVVVCDTEEEEIQQIVQDKNCFGFNLIMLTNNAEPNKCNQIPCWNWYKEETDLVNAL